ncbi:extracellular solute-binding protein [Paenibacillus spongiae]|uniref:Extracellular solute-binding protein n=1 Tax=Paenibacillus spongiae TaxID=2909671 RepID=A0ABY5S7Q7_9BACL|nr:extracellular solute-binding protein [Paenibacillus spongiae]UVI28363.1 extracellular solute-binding protein [Paenibacillus spongiae]
MKRRLTRRGLIAIIWGAVLLGIGLLLFGRGWLQDEEAFITIDVSAIPMNSAATDHEAPLSYIQWLKSDSITELKQIPADDSAVSIQAYDYAAVSADAVIRRVEDEERSEPVIEWENASGWLEWEIDVSQDGLYELFVDYAPLKGSFASIVRGIQIDGAYPFDEAERIVLDRSWKDGKTPYDKNQIGNEIRPVQQEIAGWRTRQAADYGVSSEPLLWPLTKGRHTIRMTGGREPVAIHALTFAASKPIPSYADYRKTYEGLAGGQDPKWFELFEAERFAAKSAIGIQTQSVAEPYASPDPKGRLVYNTLGGDRWQTAGEWVEWDIAVPEDGLYAIDLKYLQGYNGKANAYRTLTIDGAVPFREMLHYSLKANDNLEIGTIADPDGQPYRFYLTKGTHRLRLIADASTVKPAVIALQQKVKEIAAIDRDIRIITGNYGMGSSMNLDTGRTWEIKTYDPDIDTKLARIIEDLKKIRDYVNGLNQHVTDPTTAISSAVHNLEELLDDVNEIPNKVQLLSDIQASLGTWMKPMESQALQLDYIVVRSPEAKPGLKEPGTWDRIRYSTVNFGRTFFQTYDLKDVNEEDAITVWVQRGRDYVDLLQKQIEQDFTPSTGIKVNVNLMPNPNVLMLGNAAGDQPDVALGVGMEMPVDFAMRGASADLTRFDGFAEVEQRFNPGVMRSYKFDGGTYALPETQSFMALFYRTDVLEQLNLTPPDTWEDVMRMLPTLQDNGKTFFYPAKEFAMPFYQHGTEFYTPDGMNAKLNDNPSITAFKQWTDWFSKYDLPKDVPAFFNHFRFGDIPIGIADFNTYIQLQVAAPEIMGRWKMAPLPGIKQPDGSVARWSMQPTQSAMIMKNSENQERAWTFLQWWTSAGVQAQYANDIESFAGIEYRWNTANIEAMKLLPWPSEDLAVLTEQSRWAKNMPYVPGYYFLGREMDFAWNNTVISRMAPQEALEKSAVSLQREMVRKQEELGFGPETDMHVPPHNKPYEGSAP